MLSRKRRANNTVRARLHDHDTSRTLARPDLVFKAFTECMKQGDHLAALEILAGSLRHLNKARLARRYDVPRRTVYNLLQKKSIPGLDVIAKVCHAIHAEAAVSAHAPSGS